MILEGLGLKYFGIMGDERLNVRRASADCRIQRHVAKSKGVLVYLLIYSVMLHEPQLCSSQLICSYYEASCIFPQHRWFCHRQKLNSK